MWHGIVKDVMEMVCTDCLYAPVNFLVGMDEQCKICGGSDDSFTDSLCNWVNTSKCT